jgi:hypothetical protein
MGKAGRLPFAPHSSIQRIHLRHLNTQSLLFTYPVQLNGDSGESHYLYDFQLRMDGVEKWWQKISENESKSLIERENYEN